MAFFSCVSFRDKYSALKETFNAKYSVPFFIDPETFGLKYDFQDTKTLSDPEVTKGLASNAVDSVSYSSGDADSYLENANSFEFVI